MAKNSKSREIAKQRRTDGDVRRADDKRSKQLIEITKISMEAHSGPLPHPQTMANYEMIQPGAASIILNMAQEAQQAGIRRSDAEIGLARTTVRVEVLGMLLAYSLMLIFLGAGTWLISTGHEAPGITALVTAIAGIGWAVYRRHSKPEESKTEQLDLPLG